MTTEHSNKPDFSVASADTICRLKEAIDRGDVRISVGQKAIVDHLFDRAVPRNNGTHAMDPRHLAKRMSNVFKSGKPGACVGAKDGFKHKALFMDVLLANTGMGGAVAERMLTPKDD